MNTPKLERLFNSARQELAPIAPFDFEIKVMSAIRREPSLGPASITDQLSALFPRLGFAAAALIGLCIAADFCLANFVQEDLTATVAEASEQWLFAVR